MTIYEVTRRSLEPFLPPLYRHVRTRLRREIAGRQGSVSILDVGGRKSPYTIGVPGRVTIIDLPRESETQNALNLGINTSIAGRLKKNRSNIEDVVFGDMTRSELPSDSFDIVVSVEVLEHVEEDERFVSEVCRVLRPGGLFLMTTPNGDYVENKNPDHKRHYKFSQLSALLESHFSSVTVEYAIAGGKYRKRGLKSWSAKHPIQTASSAIGNIVNARQSSRPGIELEPVGTHHLFAIARK